MIIPTRGKYLCEVLSRIRKTKSGLWLSDKLKEEKTDNIAKCIGIGDKYLKLCQNCHDKRLCKARCRGKGKYMSIILKRGDIAHFKEVFAQKFKYEDRNLVFITNEDIIAIENESGIHANGSMVIIKLIYADKMRGILVPDSAKQNSGEYWGEVVSVGYSFPDKTLKKGDKLLFLRNEGFKFKTYNTNETMYAIREKWIAGKKI